MSYGKIKAIDIQHFKLPLEANMGDALHGLHDHFELVTATVTMDNGQTGTGYTYTGGSGGSSITSLLKDDLVPALIGKELNSAEELTDFMNTKIHYVARGGIASFAISTIDIALWDVILRIDKKPLANVFGKGADKVRTYYGGIDLLFTLDELKANVQKQIKNGHTAIKIKLGKADEKEDLARVKAIRELIGPDAMFLVDANMVWSVEQAIRMAKAMEQYNITWLEEPTNPDDYDGYARIGQATTIPISMGENLHSVYEHTLGMEIGRVKEPIVDASNLCGITGCFRTAKVAEKYSLRVSTHGMQELHVNILGALENRAYLEFHSFPIYEYTINPIQVVDGYVATSKEIGVGVNFDWDKLAPFLV